MTRELICKGLQLNDDINRLESFEKNLLEDADEHLLFNLIREFNKINQDSFGHDDFKYLRRKFISRIQEVREEKEKELAEL